MISLNVLVGGTVASCANEPATPAVNPTVAAAAAGVTAASRVGDDALRAAAGCPGCRVMARSTVSLPLTSNTVVDAKLVSADGSPRAATVDLGGRAVDLRALLAAEGTAKVARQGKLRDVVLARSSTSSSELAPVSIWADFEEGHEPRQRMASDASFRAAYQAQTAARLRAVTSKVTAWLDAHGYATYDRGADTPLITADVPANALADLGRVDGVSVVDLRRADVPNGLTWFDAIKGPAAQMVMGSAGGINYCNGEGTQPYDTSYLSVAGILDSSSLFAHHVQWTSELVSATAYTSTAPGAYVYFPAYDHGAGNPTNYTFYQSWSWCFGQGVNNMNRSSSFLTMGPIPPAPDDMAEDYYAYHWPYPFITLSAGNCEVSGYGVDCVTGSPEDGGYVENHSHNALVVGSSDTNFTAQTGDDNLSFFSAYGNPATTHHDFELPNLVAPGSEDGYEGVTSASNYDDSGTSASAPMVMGTALLMKAKDSTLNIWPELIRAIILSAATHPVDGGRTETLSHGDIRQGAGLLNAQVALTLADSSLNAAPNNTPMPRGRNGTTYSFSTDFPSGISAPYNIVADLTGDLRVVIAWDATAQGCSATDGSGCSGDALDADLDLRVSHYVDGAWQDICDSTTWDSSWELCDVHADAGELYKAEIVKWGTNTTQTYLGIAWNTYDPNAE